jgi:hypothetical protein
MRPLNCNSNRQQQHQQPPVAPAPAAAEQAAAALLLAAEQAATAPEGARVLMGFKATGCRGCISDGVIMPG